MENLIAEIKKLVEIFKDGKVTEEELPQLAEALLSILVALLPILIKARS